MFLPASTSDDPQCFLSEAARYAGRRMGDYTSLWDGWRPPFYNKIREDPARDRREAAGQSVDGAVLRNAP